MILSDLSFPIFLLGKEKPLIESNVAFYLLGKDIKYSDAEYKVNLIDDKNLPAATLAKRRLILNSQGVSLVKLNKAIFFLGDLIKLAKGAPWFIDSVGFIFQYKKTHRAKLKFYKIAKVLPMPAGGAIIEAEGIATRFKVLFQPSDYHSHAGILHWKNTLILYGLYDKKYSDTTRLI